jgi:hypothetical protein
MATATEESTRPPRTYIAPAVRVLKLADTMPSGEDDGTEIPEIKFDLVSAEVTLLNTGSSQYTLTLNNWFTALPGDADALQEAQELAQERRADGGAWPRFKYNDFQVLRFGMRLRIEMRYWPDAKKNEVPFDDANLRVWIPVISGPITEMTFSFSASEGARLTVVGEDDLRVLKDKSPRRIQFRDFSERKIVEQVLTLAGDPGSFTKNGPPLPCQVSSRQVALTVADDHDWPAVMKDDGRGVDETLDEGQTFLDCLNRLAERYDFELFLEYVDLDKGNGGKRKIAQRLHFEPARSKIPPDPQQTLVLRQGKTLLDYKPTIKIADQFTCVRVNGRDRDRLTPRRVEHAPVSVDLFQQELHDELFGFRAPSPGPVLRQRFFGENADVTHGEQNLDNERALQIAIARFRRKARECFTIEATTIGLPDLRPGRHVAVDGLGAPFDGVFYVTQAVHSYGASGLRTRLCARRPGMFVP